MKHKLFSFLFGMVLIIYFFTGIPSARAESLFDIQPGEKTLTALYKGTASGAMELQTEKGLETFDTAPDFVMALSGKRTGKLINPEDFPRDIDTEVIINSKNQVRAVKNSPLPTIELQGRTVPGRGYDLSYSPDRRHYLLFDYITGLSLYSPEKELYSSLSSEPTAAWNSTGTKFACVFGQNLIVYDLSMLDRPQIVELPALPAETVRIIMGLEWSADSSRLLYYCLEDLPELGSDVFRMAITDLLGNQLGSKTVTNLGYASWADDNSILFVTYTDLDFSFGKISLWHPDTGIDEVILSWQQGICKEFAYNKEKQVIAYTSAKGIGEEIRYLKLFNNDEGCENAVYSPFPIRNMQWSKDNSLYYWDEFNELIWTVRDPPDGILKPKPIGTGYLSKNSVQNGFLYFLAEPVEESLQPYIYRK